MRNSLAQKSWQKGKYMVQAKPRWIELQEFPNYAVCEDGSVMNTRTDMLKQPSRNQQGINVVNLSINNTQHIRSLAPLIAAAFIDRSEIPGHFDTPIHLDGDRDNCGVWNLAWRPRWFARKYHQQFTPWERENRFGFQTPVILLDTDEIFPTSWEPAVKYGLLDREIFIATLNRTFVFPHNFRFEEWEETYI